MLVPHFVEVGMPVWSLGNGGWETEDRRGETGAMAFGKLSQSQDTAVVTPANSLRTAGMVPLAYWRLAQVVKRERVDLIHADLPVAGILARAVGKQVGIPTIYTEHNLIERYHPVTRSVHRSTLGWHDYVLTVSDEVQTSVRQAGSDRKTMVRTLRNGVPVEQVRQEASDSGALRTELAIPAEHLIVGSVAVFRSQKRLEDWLAVAARVAAAHNDVTFLLVGDGPEMAMVQAQVQALGLCDRIRLPGFREDGRRFLGLLDIYLMTSRFEGLPIALLEAMALGKPVVATNVGGIPEAVTHGAEGLLTAVGAIDELTNHVTQLLAQPRLRKRLGQAGATKVEEHFHIRHRVTAIETIYQMLLSSAK